MFSAIAAAVMIVGTPQDSSPPGVKTVSSGEHFVLEKALAPERPNLLIFYNERSSAEKALAAQISERAARDPRVAVRLVKLPHLDCAAARENQVTETPTVLVIDRFGNTLARTSKMEEIVPAVAKALTLARIKWVSESDPEAAEVYKAMGGGKRPVAQIIKTMSLQPAWMEMIARLSGMAHFSDTHLPRKTKELIATYVSAINHCKF